MDKAKVYLIHHQGMGDMLLCLGLYRQLARISKKLTVPVRNPYFKTMKHLLSDLKNVDVIEIPFMGRDGQGRRHEMTVMRVMSIFYKLTGARIVKLGYLGQQFLKPENLIRYDENFYRQANIPFNHRWDSFSFPRREIEEAEISRQLIPPTGKYIFLHEDKSRGFTINRKLLPEGAQIVEPKEPSGEFFVTDYTSLILGASQIHVIESSFAALIEGLDPEGGLFAHRYARPEAKANWQQEFTYRNSWHVYA